MKSFNVKSIIGEYKQFRTVHCGQKGDTSRSWVVSLSNEFKEDICISGYVNVTFEEQFKLILLKIVDAYFMESRNGGRTNTKHYDSVSDYYNDPDVKKTVMRVAYGDFVDRLSYSGDPDRVDLYVRFETGDSISSPLWEYTPPKEWYSEVFKDDPRFTFPDGLFETVIYAVDAVGNKSHDDLFGERYFPVLVFPKEVGTLVVEDVACQAKNHSNLLELHGNIIVGLRCKLFEFADCITACYKAGGKVAKNQDWDWS